MEGFTVRTDKLPSPSFLLIIATLLLTSGASPSRGSNIIAPAAAAAATMFCHDRSHGHGGDCLLGDDMELEYLIDSPYFPSRMLAGETCPRSRTATTNAKDQPGSCGRSYVMGKPYTPCVPPPNCEPPCDAYNRACH
ncbi:uncharacterized protein J3R85_004700 [Psidium guajava]|nr:uncharacterized protein J3R85_004700 [Psidium guajava]